MPQKSTANGRLNPGGPVPKFVKSDSATTGAVKLRPWSSECAILKKSEKPWPMSSYTTYRRPFPSTTGREPWTKPFSNALSAEIIFVGDHVTALLSERWKEILENPCTKCV